MKAAEPLRLTMPMAWLAGMSVITAMASSIISQGMTGKWPWELAKDGKELMRNLIFPRIDPKDASQRVSIPTYWRDLVHLTHSPPSYVTSSMTGEIGRITISGTTRTSMEWRSITRTIRSRRKSMTP